MPQTYTVPYEHEQYPCQARRLGPSPNCEFFHERDGTEDGQTRVIPLNHPLGTRMTPEALQALIFDMTDAQKLRVLRLLEIATARASAHYIIIECGVRGLDLDRTLAELSRRLWTN